MVNETVKNIQALFDTEVTTYQIHSDTGLSNQLIDGYRVGGRPIDKMTLVKARILEEYYLKCFKEKD